MNDNRAYATCAHCGPLPEGERLYEITGEQFHAVLLREGDGVGSYNGPTPDEYEPCGPVTVATDSGDYGMQNNVAD